MRKRNHNILDTIPFWDREIVKINSVSEDEFPYNIDVLAENLTIPWAIALSEDGDIYFTERKGTIRKIHNGVLQPEPLLTLTDPFRIYGEGGLMGLVLDPNFSENHYMYIMYTYKENNNFYNRVQRLVEEGDKLILDKIIVDKIPGARVHNGGRIKVGPDNKLYITTGDAGRSSLSQDFMSLAGKILRVELDGEIPADNPISVSPVLTYGHRNPQGLAWNSEGKLYESEHGNVAHDEINIIIPGENYGWPLYQGDEMPKNSEETIMPPIFQSGNITYAPSGITFINEGPWEGNLLVASLRGERLLRFILNEDGTKVENVESWLQNKYGRLREVVEGKDGTIYITTSNRDGRSRLPAVTDDKILRLTPK